METTNVMKSILTILISFGLAFSVFGQTRNVVVGTNGAIVQPTNFWSADVTNARSGLGLGSAATNSSSAFQPSSVALSNLASSNGSILTNIQASNIVGVISSSNISSVVFTNISGVLTIDQGGTSATNAYDARQNFGITAIGDALFTASNAATARTAIGGTDVGSSVFTLANPSAITFLRINSDNTVSAIGASDFRTAIGLGSSATNASSAFQPSSSMLTNLASSNAFYLSNIQASNITGLLGLTNGGTGADNAINARANLGLGSASTNPASAFQPSSAVLSNLASSNGVNLTNITISNLTGVLTTNGNAVGLTNFPTYLLRTNGDGVGLTNLTAANITGTVALASNVTGTIAISNGGTGATNAATARTNLGLDSTNNAFSSLSVGVDITNSSTSSDASSAFGRQITIDSTVENSIAVGFGHSMSNFGVGAGGSVLLGGRGVMTNWGAFLFNGVEQGGTIGYSKGNSTFTVIASNGIYLDGPIKLIDVQGAATDTGILQISAGGGISRVMTNKSTATPAFFGWNGFSNLAFSIAESRTNLGLAWSALTNSNAGTSLVSVDTNGIVVSPTNFWQVAPIQTLVQSIIPVTNSTNAATNARNLYIYSLATNIINVTNTITLPTNTSVFDGDEVTVTHRGGSNSVTAVRQLGSTNNLISLNSYDESVKFIKDGNWDFYHNISFTEAIKFSGTNAAANAAASRTNLGLGTTNNVTFSKVAASKINDENNNPTFSVDMVSGALMFTTNIIISWSGSEVYFSTPLFFAETIDAATTRTNLDIPLAALTNTSTTNFQKAIFYTNTAPSNIGGNLGSIAAWIEIVASNGVTYKVPAYTNIP